MDVMEKLKKTVSENAVVIFMKGTPQFPQCGFSARASEALNRCGEQYAYVNIFDEPEVMKNLPAFSDWPTFPQIFVDGELIGGCDITVELYESGELEKLVKEAVTKKQAVGSA
ncbi:MAG: monothiol glutaredoxin [Halothiobacillaceae bacterium]|nr:MAG: monothiol glutaredoxin [Halothiobacillaceae bacterium]